LPAPAAVEVWCAFLDSQQGDKEQADVVIDPLGISLMQAASGATPGRTVQRSGLGLDTRDENTHKISLNDGQSQVTFSND
jgi:hypothetical protein